MNNNLLLRFAANQIGYYKRIVANKLGMWPGDVRIIRRPERTCGDLLPTAGSMT
jgi:hypothetical protein